jgi:hypothetical protein
MLKVFFIALIPFFLLIHAGKLVAATISISGKAPEYRGNTIELYVLHDFISGEKIPVAQIRFSADGSFSTQITITETNVIYSEFDGYLAQFFAEPGQNYKLIFPPKRVLTEAEKRNPFFKPDPVFLGVESPDPNELNHQIEAFENACGNLESKYFERIFLNKSQALIDTIKNKLAVQFPRTTNPYFETYKTFRLSTLEYALHQGKNQAFIKSRFIETKPQPNVPTYCTVFKQQFGNYFRYSATNPDGDQVRELVNSGNLAELMNFLRTNKHFPEATARLITLLGLKDAYYSNQFDKKSILRMLHEASQQTNWSTADRETAQYLYAQITYLAQGSTPPAIHLKNLQGKPVSLESFQDKWVYLHFTDPNNPISRQHLDFLKKIAANYPQLVIVNVIPSTAAAQVSKAGWAGIFTTTTDDIEKLYKVRTFPVSYLIGKNGKLQFSPAPNPLDGFERQFSQLVNTERIRQMRENK